MPKLTKDKAEAAAAASNSFEPIEDGVYHARLRDVDASRPDGPAGPYWVWEYEIVEDGEYRGRRVWNNTSLSQDWVFKQTFDAFGVETDTDTDELCGKIVKLAIVQRVIQQGPRKGEMGQNVQRIMPADEDFVAEADAVAARTADDDIF